MNKKLNKLPRARTGYQVQGSLINDVPAFGGADYNAYIGKPGLKSRNTMGAVPRDEANIEAEGGETLVGDLDGSTFPSFFNIKGPRHSAGGVPMNLPDDTFIFSDTASMKITDPKILKMFGKDPKKGGFTPAELSKSYEINKYRKILQDPDSNKMEKKTAEMMIKNYVMKLGALAIAQESKKGFPQGIPVIAKPYMEANGITEEDLMPELAQQRQEQEQMMQQQQSMSEEPMMEQDQQMPPQEMNDQMMSEEEYPMEEMDMEEDYEEMPEARRGREQRRADRKERRNRYKGMGLSGLRLATNDLMQRIMHGRPEEYSNEIYGNQNTLPIVDPTVRTTIPPVNVSPEQTSYVDRNIILDPENEMFGTQYDFTKLQDPENWKSGQYYFKDPKTNQYYMAQGEYGDIGSYLPDWQKVTLPEEQIARLKVPVKTMKAVLKPGAKDKLENYTTEEEVSQWYDPKDWLQYKYDQEREGFDSQGETYFQQMYPEEYARLKRQFGGNSQYAQYGITLGGGNPNNYLGRTKKLQGSGPFMAKQGIIMGGMHMPLIMSNGGSTYNLNKFQGGGQITEADLTKQDLEVIAKKWNNNKQAYINFINTKNAIEGNEDFKNDLFRQYQQDIENKENYTKSQREKLYSGYAPELRKLDKQGVVNQLLAQEERNARLEAFGLDASKTEQNVSGNTGTNAAANKLIKENPDGLGDLDFSSGFKGQAAYIAYRNLLGTEKYKPYGDFQVGKDDEEIAGKRGQVSGIDQFNTNTTLGQRVKFVPPTKVSKCFCPDPITGEEKETPLKDGKCECEQTLDVPGQEEYPAGTYWPEWTTQDKLNLSRARSLRTGIEYPTAMTFQRPELNLRAQEWLAPVQAQQAAAAKNMDTISRIGAPSQYKQAIMGSLQGDLLEGIQRPITETQAKNLAVKNQESILNYQGDLSEGQNRQNVLNPYMDKVGSTENLYRGELNAKDALTTQMMNQGIKNAADIYNIQSEQYAIDPVTGVQVFKQGKPISPEQPTDDMIAFAQKLEGSHLPEDMQELIFKTQYGRYGGRVMQIGGMVYGDTVYPFYYYE